MVWGWVLEGSWLALHVMLIVQRGKNHIGSERRKADLTPCGLHTHTQSI